MNAKSLLKLAKISSALEKRGFNRESDKVSNVLHRFAAFWQGPLVDIPMLERAWPFTIVDEDFEEADELRQEFPRYVPFESLITEHGDWEPEDDSLFESLEEALHPGESDPEAGIVFLFPDHASSLMQGKDWGKEMEEHDKNNASGERYKNLTPKFY